MTISTTSAQAESAIVARCQLQRGDNAKDVVVVQHDSKSVQVQILEPEWLQTNVCTESYLSVINCNFTQALFLPTMIQRLPWNSLPPCLWRTLLQISIAAAELTRTAIAGPCNVRMHRQHQLGMLPVFLYICGGEPAGLARNT